MLVNGSVLEEALKNRKSFGLSQSLRAGCKKFYVLDSYYESVKEKLRDKQVYLFDLKTINKVCALTLRHHRVSVVGL